MNPTRNSDLADSAIVTAGAPEGPCVSSTPGVSAASVGVRERRAAARRRVLKGAWITYGERRFRIPCTLRDVSSSGARLCFARSLAVPSRFELDVDLDGIEVACEVVWRKPDSVGVLFTSPVRKVVPERVQVVGAVRSRPPATRPTLRRRSIAA
jgi:hypothetical protein